MLLSSHAPLLGSWHSTSLVCHCPIGDEKDFVFHLFCTMHCCVICYYDGSGIQKGKIEVLVTYKEWCIRNLLKAIGTLSSLQKWKKITLWAQEIWEKFTLVKVWLFFFFSRTLRRSKFDASLTFFRFILLVPIIKWSSPAYPWEFLCTSYALFSGQCFVCCFPPSLLAWTQRKSEVPFFSIKRNGPKWFHLSENESLKSWRDLPPCHSKKKVVQLQTISRSYIFASQKGPSAGPAIHLDKVPLPPPNASARSTSPAVYYA